MIMRNPFITPITYVRKRASRYACRLDGHLRITLRDTYRLESGDLGVLLVVSEAVLHVVDGHATLGALESEVGHNGNPLVGAVAGAEEEHRRPVVGQVLRELARRARRLARHVLFGIHGLVERVLRARESK